MLDAELSASHHDGGYGSVAGMCIGCPHLVETASLGKMVSSTIHGHSPRRSVSACPTTWSGASAGGLACCGGCLEHGKRHTNTRAKTGGCSPPTTSAPWTGVNHPNHRRSACTCGTVMTTGVLVTATVTSSVDTRMKLQSISIVTQLAMSCIRREALQLQTRS